MIRFSAALVAVAIGVLIGGIATSKLLLVYVAIAVSAVALVVLAIGVLLKREELFGEGQGLAPAQAGASPVLSARAGDTDYQNRPNSQVTPPLSQGAVVGPGAAFARHGQAVLPQSGSAQSGNAQSGRAQPGRAQSGGTWETQAGRGSWPSPATAAPPSASWQAPPVSGATTAGWGAQAAGEARVTGGPAAAGGTGQGGRTAPRSWDPLSSGTSAPSAFAPRPVGRPPAGSGAGAGSASSSWFNSSDKGPSAEPPATAPTPAPGAGGGWSWLNSDARDTTEHEDKGKPEGAAVVDEDDDWPTRYSWLEDEPEENGETSAPATGKLTTDADTDTEVDDEPFAGTDAAADELATRHLVRDPDLGAQAPGAPGPPEKQPPAATAGAGGRLVTVVRGVPRFHEQDCILIRFMPEGDTQKLSVAQAREAGCTPCTACEPEG